ncbi:mRNA splicing factor Cwf21 [Penicillium angulare]|uniref:mRNA splicing factor Cwf21 n=1 Tax=Penicillium angulare TaxID=116970 RepID=UPI00254183FB|nr:mRNA splicing factor Cwf21 [Penicillium angulare]KAJ5280071.1 mRNA splicing factor Cwf21 [Penicillium angulare]
MSSNVGLTTPRGSGTSGYVQRNSAFIKPRSTGSGAPYPPMNGPDRSFKQRVPDKQILEHDRRRAIEVKVMEERERLEEENERIEEDAAAAETKIGKGKETEKDIEEGEEEKERVLSDEEIDERCESLRKKLLEELERGDGRGGGNGSAQKDRKIKSYAVHELAEAKMKESERLRKALGIREDSLTGEISSSRRGRSD